MTTMDLTRIFLDETHTKFPKKNFENNKIIYKHFDETWNIHFADMIDYKTAKMKGFRYIFVKSDTFSKCIWCVLLKNRNGQTITNNFSNIIKT